MKEKKLYIGLIVFMIVAFLLVYFLFGRDIMREKKKRATLLVGNQTVWTYQNRRWENDNNYNSYNWENFHTYLNGQYFGKYSLWHDDRWYGFDSNKNAVSLDGIFLAYSSNFDIDVKEVTQETDVDKTYINYVLKDNNLDVDSKMTACYRYSFDFDNDGEVEDFYVMSNVFAMNFTPDVEFSIVFMVKSEKIYYLYNETYEGSFNGCKPYFSGFLDLDQDNCYEIILSCGKYSVEEEINTMFKFQKSKFKIMISNQK